MMGTGGVDTHVEVTRLQRDLQRVLHFEGESSNVDFYISSLTEHNPFNTTEEIVQWLRDMNSIQYFHVSTLALAELNKWRFDDWTGDLVHESGGFFSIRGLRVSTNIGPVRRWTQPIIDQPEIGVLGIVTKKINGILYFLMQAKPEPGNINSFQLSPTVQATRSNYTRVHGGKPTRYLDYFLNATRARTLVDQLQSEQGARFYRKRNRNIIVRIRDDEDIELEQDNCWVTLGQLKRLMRIDNTVNMDSRSVISSINYDPDTKTSLEPICCSELRDALESSPLTTKPVSEFGLKLMVSAHGATHSLYTEDELLRQVARNKFNCELDARLIPLNEVRDWVRTPHEILHKDRKFFSIIGVRVEAANREVPAWDQPIVRQVHPGIVGFIAREIDGVIHLLVQLKMESGNMDLLELAPTVQCITGSYRHANVPPFVDDMCMSGRGEVIFDVRQSEEGGRFYHEENRNVLRMVDGGFSVKEPSHYLWMSLKQLNYFVRFSNLLNVEARSLLAIM